MEPSSIKCHACSTQYAHWTVPFASSSSPPPRCYPSIVPLPFRLFRSRTSPSTTRHSAETSSWHLFFLKARWCQHTAPLSPPPPLPLSKPRRAASEYLMAPLCLCASRWMGSIGWESILSGRGLPRGASSWAACRRQVNGDWPSPGVQRGSRSSEGHKHNIDSVEVRHGSAFYYCISYFMVTHLSPEFNSAYGALDVSNNIFNITIFYQLYCFFASQSKFLKTIIILSLHNSNISVPVVSLRWSTENVWKKYVKKNSVN